MQRIIQDSRFQYTVGNLSQRFRMQASPAKRTAHWLAQVLNKDGDGQLELRSRALELPWYQFFALDLVVFTTCFVLTVQITSFVVIVNKVFYPNILSSREANIILLLVAVLHALLGFLLFSQFNEDNTVEG